MNKLIISALASVCALGLSTAAEASKYTAPHEFCMKTNCSDGSTPWAPPVSDGAGHYYGTATSGGRHHEGAVYRMTLNGTHWTYDVLYSFCAGKKCADGEEPRGGLVIDTNGNLYGTAFGGGTNGWGLVYELSPDGANWDYKVLYDFCSVKNCADGSQPDVVTLAYQGQASGMPYDGKSALYGTTFSGGASPVEPLGTVFSLTQKSGNWSENVVYSFCPKSGCADGAGPYSGVMVDGSGNLFGTTSLAGKYGKGSLYELERNAKSWTYKALHNFCADQTACADGFAPTSVPMMDGDGELIGSAVDGGSGPGPVGGVIYKVVLGAKIKYSVLHSFCLETNCTDGAQPYGAMQFDAGGNLYGTTYEGGANNRGVIFRLTRGKLTTFTKLVDMGGPGTPGGSTLSGLMLGASGAFYGASANGGDADGGVFFKFVP